jgi:hypothetical protein
MICTFGEYFLRAACLIALPGVSKRTSKKHEPLQALDSKRICAGWA